LSSSETERAVLDVVRSLVWRRDGSESDVTRDAVLDDDLGLDSLELAELSAILEEQFGRDPYTAGVIPRTVGDVVDFYAD